MSERQFRLINKRRRAARSPEAIEAFRRSIDANRLKRALEEHVSGIRILTPTQIRAAESLLAMAIPKENIVKSEISGPGGGPLELALSADQRLSRLLQVLAVAKAKQVDK